MAIKWAVANGNWNAGATWNDGSVPADGDEVYLDGYQVTANADINTLCTVTNGMNNITGRSGGTIIIASNRIISINDIIGGTDYTIPVITITLANSRHITINANISGYIRLNSGSITSVSRASLTINGNLSASIIQYSCINIYNDYIINGNVDISNSQYNLFHTGDNSNVHYAANLTINGNITTGNNQISRHKQLAEVVINGNITTNSSNALLSNITAAGFCYFNGRLVSSNGATLSDNLQKLKVSELTQMQFPDLNGAPVVLSAYPLVVDYPPENEVKEGTEYAWGEKVGQYIPDYPPESVVLKDYEYGDSDDRKTGIMEQEVNVEVGCVTPEDVRKDVPLVGMGVVGTLVVPSVDDVREGVVFDNGSVGTLIVQGGGDRLRIADFGYYTNAQSDTYIVDLTEQDKPKFAVAEERVLIEMFPDLDLDNISEKYFDDLFVKYLKYRLIVEYYRTAGINSTFTPSEPTTEIVNYQNVRNEVWLNSANIYLKAWSKKFPESITKPQRILL